MQTLQSPTRWLIGILVAIALIVAACGNDDPTSTGEPEPTATSTPEPAPTSEPDPTTASPTVRRLWIGPETADCEGVAPQTCLLVSETADGPAQFFYDAIEGFDHVIGTSYVIDVEVTEVEDPPADGSSLSYRLIEIVSEETTDPTQNDGGDADEGAGYLRSEDVPAYVAAYEAATANASIGFDGENPERLLSVDFVDGIVLTSETLEVSLELADDGVAGVTAVGAGTTWTTVDLDAIEYRAVPEGLDPSSTGTVFDASFPVVDDADPSTERVITVVFDQALIGGGNSTVEVVDGYATISGVLGTSTYLQLRDVIAAHPDIDTLVMLNVEGSENDEINVHTSRLIRAAGWDTYVPANGDISSGGVDMFAAGVERIIEPGAFLGVHSWGAPGEDIVAADLPRDHPAHRSQLDYWTDMLGDEDGTEFYFYTLNAAPFDLIHRMTAEEIAASPIVTATTDQRLPESVVGRPAGYLEIVDGQFLKLTVDRCASDGASIEAELSNPDLGSVEIGDQTIVFGDLPAPYAIHPVDLAPSADGRIEGTADLDLEDLFGVDTSDATIEFACPAG